MTLDRPPERERIFNLPVVVVVLCAVLLLVQASGSVLSAESFSRLLIRFAFVPGRFTFAFDPDQVSAAFNQIARDDEVRAQIAAAFLGNGTIQWWTVLTYAFLHGGWAHVGLNCLWLVAFGGAVAKRLTASGFLGFMAICAVVGALVHYLTHIADLEPVIGASAAVSGAMGAATRFMFQQGSITGRRPDLAPVQPAMSLRQTLGDRRALGFIAIWFVSNLLFGLSGIVPGFGEGTIAWQAHIGGFLAGLLLFGWFDRSASRASPDMPNRDPAALEDDRPAV